MAKTWVCMECKREQPDQEFQCSCGNIDPILFEEKDMYSEQDGRVITMEDQTPAETVTMTEETPVKKPKKKRRKSK